MARECTGEFRRELERLFGSSVSFDPQILRSYDHDVGEMPGLLMAMVRHRPDAVVVARGADDVRSLLRVCRVCGVPVTPRAQATSGYGGCIPGKGGVVLDLCSFDRLLAVDGKSLQVDVEPGMVWGELSRRLASHGMDVRVCPTSAPSSTVGGWFAMGGVGIGSLRYGSIADTVVEIDVVTPDGDLRTCSGAEMEPFHQTCGTLGVVTRLRLACRKAEVLRTPAVALPDAGAVAAFLERIREAEVHSACAQSAPYCAMRAEATGRAPAVKEGFLLSLAIPEGVPDGGVIEDAARSLGGRMLAEDVGEEEWRERHYPMRIKRNGPSLLVGEFVVPWGGFAPALADIAARLPRDRLGVEAFAVRGGTMAVLVYMLDDARSPIYPVRMVKAMVPLHVAARHGGRGYATGMWFAAAADAVFGREKARLVRARKAATDPEDMLNPCKTAGPALPFLPFVNLSRCILTATAVLEPLAGLVPAARPRSAGPGGES
ncbi:MAG: FAD-binding oxidoreductase [Desulfovibrio sp.]|jgi:FAD/FMN-containing dehydrogenase|nr:FAD-binding oxidoreductase [Desulfovibrio sp.]